MSDKLATYIRLHASSDFDKARLDSHLERVVTYLAKQAATEDFRAEVEAEKRSGAPIAGRDLDP